jgi:hypothetical protein
VPLARSPSRPASRTTRSRSSSRYYGCVRQRFHSPLLSTPSPAISFAPAPYHLARTIDLLGHCPSSTSYRHSRPRFRPVCRHTLPPSGQTARSNRSVVLPTAQGFHKLYLPSPPSRLSSHSPVIPPARSAVIFLTFCVEARNSQ